MTATWDWGVPLVYAGLAATAAGLFSLLWPLRFLGIRGRGAAAAAALAGAALLAAGVFFPAPIRSAAPRVSRLDHILPEFQFGEFHETRVRATPREVFRAILQVTAPEIRYFRLLTWIRSPRLGAAPPSILTPPPDRPILDVALQSGFVLLGQDPDREIVFGTLPCRRMPGTSTGTGSLTPEAFRDLSDSDSCKAAMNFRIAPDSGGFVRLTTETRVFALGTPALRRFAAYWRVILPGSALIRRSWLDAIRRRAEMHRPPCVDAIAAFLRPVDEALSGFEKEEVLADTVIAQSLLVRGKLEAAAIDPECADAKREALIYLNHLIPAFQAYLGRGVRNKAARDELDSIVRRGRAHEARAVHGSR